MAHRRRHRRARENPLSDTTTIVLAVGVTAVVVGVGYYFYKRQQVGALSAGAQQFAPQLPAGQTRGQPPPDANTGGSATTQQQQQQQLAVFSLRDAGNAGNANTTDPDAAAKAAVVAVARANYERVAATPYAQAHPEFLAKYKKILDDAIAAQTVAVAVKGSRSTYIDTGGGARTTHVDTGGHGDADPNTGLLNP